MENKNKPKLWVFGDSFSVPFSKHFSTYNDWSDLYKQFKNNVVPKTFSEIISQKLDLELINLSSGGCSNHTILSEFIKIVNQVEKNDILLFGWTVTSRFRLSDNFNNLMDITYALKHPSPNEYVSQKSLVEYAVNRSNNSVFLTEINEYMKLINFSLKNNKIIHWTWVSPDSHELNLNGKFEKKNYEGKIVMVSQFFKLSEKIKNYMLEFGGNHTYNGFDLDISDFEDGGKINKLVNEKKCVLLINIENMSHIHPYINSKYNVIDFHSDDYVKKYYESLFPYKNYQTIKEETNGLIDDLHYSEKGHLDLANDMIKVI